jgi:hypothetical protein
MPDSTDLVPEVLSPLGSSGTTSVVPTIVLIVAFVLEI